MRPWNIILTIRPGSRHASALLGEMRRRGDFHRTPFRDVLIGLVPDPQTFLDDLVGAREGNARWIEDLVRAIPVERVFSFTPDTLVELWSEALPCILDRMRSGTCFVRLERRGLIGVVHSVTVERAVAERLFDLADARGVQLGVSFADPDYIVLAETVGSECGLALLTRDMRQRYRFIKVR